MGIESSIEVTQVMRDAGADALAGYNTAKDTPWDKAEEIFTAMLAACSQTKGKNNLARREM